MSPVVRILGTDFPPTMSTSQAATLMGCSSELLQRKAKTGDLPVRPLQLGHRLRWPSALVAQAVGLPFELVEPDGDSGVVELRRATG